jgi:hypothetical protein
MNNSSIFKKSDEDHANVEKSQKQNRSENDSI